MCSVCKLAQDIVEMFAMLNGCVHRLSHTLSISKLCYSTCDVRDLVKYVSSCSALYSQCLYVY